MNGHAVRGFLAAVTGFFVLVVVHAEIARADWIQTNGPKGGTIRSLLAVPSGGSTRIYAGDIRVWSTDDNAASWTYHPNSLTHPPAFDLLAVPNGSGGNDILVATPGGVYRSTDNGATWATINNGITNLDIRALALGSNGSGGTNLYAGAFLGDAFRSTDNGATWTAITSGLPVGQATVGALMATAAGTVLAATGNGIYRSTNFGASWTRVLTNFAFSFASLGTTIIAGTSSGVWRSTNDGATWTAINTGIQSTWTYSVAMIPNGAGAILFAGAGRVMRSTNNGATWTPCFNGLPVIGINALATTPNGTGGMDLYAGTGDGVFRSTNNGDSWTNVSYVYSSVQGLEVTPAGSILAATDNDIFRSTDGGASWTETDANVNMLDFAVSLNSTSLFAGGALNGVYKSIDDGATWVDASANLEDIEVNSVVVVPNGSGGSNLLAGDYSGIFLSPDEGFTWLNVYPPAMPLDWVLTPNGSGGHYIFGGGFGGVVRSSDGGMSWTNTLLSGTPQGMAATGNGANVFAGGDPFGVYRSTDNGATWTLVNNGLTDLRITTLLSPDGSNLFAGSASGVHLSTDNGNSWTSVSTGLITGVFSLARSADGTTLYAGTTGFGVWRRPLSEMLTPIVAVPPERGLGLALHAARPNPFNARTTILYSLPQAMPVRLVIHDITGRAVRTLVNGIENAGERRAFWDGRDDRGSLVGTGMYVYRLHAGGMTLARKMALMK